MKESTAMLERFTVAIVGRPNVGKSTLFNRLTHSKKALVADVPGLTRDTKIGFATYGNYPYVVIDTGGIERQRKEPLQLSIEKRAFAVAKESDYVFFVLDGQQGLSPDEQSLGMELRALGSKIIIVVNKCENLEENNIIAEFCSLGFRNIVPISALQGIGLERLLSMVTKTWPNLVSDQKPVDLDNKAIKVAIVGRPNVGKSTLVNRMLKEDRMITHDGPGTTRDSIDTPYERGGKRYIFIDTAGVRRKSKTTGTAEKFSVVQTLHSINRATVVVLVVDAREGVVDQDLSLIGLVLASGRSLLIAVNKWDGLDTAQKTHVKRELDRRLGFARFSEIRFLSALIGTGVNSLYGSINSIWKAATASHKTPELTRLLQRAVEEHQPPLIQGRRIKLRFSHMGGKAPPTIVIHGNQVERVPSSYRRYLENYFRKSLNLVGTPIELEFRQTKNPYSHQKNTLTKRQIARRKRMIRHTKKKY
jgi:GTP-binding protein